MILIETGPTQTGKSTRLFKRFVDQPDTGGIITLHRNGLKTIYDISSRLWIPFQIREASEPVIRVGRYILSGKGFESARGILRRERERSVRWLIIDEVGPLELKGMGLEPEIMNTVHHYAKHPHRNLLLVVRESLLSQVVRHYGIESYRLFDPDSKSIP